MQVAKRGGSFRWFGVVLAVGCGARTGDLVEGAPSPSDGSGGAGPTPMSAGSSGSGGAIVTGGAQGSGRRGPPRGANVGTHPPNHGGVGGAGFMLTEVCKRCGWDRNAEPCTNLVEAVPAIDRPEYERCYSASFAFADCLDGASTTCTNVVPPECEDARSMLDGCW
jgi:hypothetical protein